MRETVARRPSKTRQPSDAGNPVQEGSLPQLVIVGRQNVGKSTLFNRITASRRAIVGNLPGMTRDRIRMPVRWKDKTLELTDTGGIIFRARSEIPSLVSDQVLRAVRDADHVIFVLDGRTELTPTDLELSDLLHRSGKPVSLAVNKCDTPSLRYLADPLSELGFRSIFPVSAEHGLGIDALMSAATRDFPAGPLPASPAPAAGIQIAILGRPNVGKSTLLNRLIGLDTAIVSPIPGTTRDAVDAEVIRRGQRFVFVDTAGIRRKGKTRAMAEKLSVVMAQRHLRMAAVALLMVDPTEGVTAQDAHIAGYIHDAGRASVIVVNKWDIAERGRAEFRSHVRGKLKMLRYAPVAFVSALTGQRVASLFPLAKKVHSAAGRRIGTGELNRFLSGLDMERVTVPGRKPKFSYVTQVAVRPPTFVFFGSRLGRFHFGLERYLVNQIRGAFGFEGTPVVVRPKSRRS